MEELANHRGFSGSWIT